ncbi:hypothetical protein DYI95_009210 [Thermaerobacter sp. PB12/4term]|uniref:right-handed parallel beta-helix repeat-containing protein n=1 Tax=Thermaerobacter sp. PB12/4term TaxID=2293838 RepID=UPI0013146F14|nr:right-handed parallel beta-helix repeat-containing protein [Thermaerobacter sp. PB12/4term]QIA27666.1 hypothetical protein DYI95_009210 [Thermaerobacter sp. PB12/4term]
MLGYRGSYLTAYNNGDYGIYAYDSVYGQFDHSYASGSPDSGFYIGQCKPCHAVITQVVAEYNALGYSGTNTGGNLTIMNSVWRYNMSGIVPNTLDSEKLAPQDGTRIVNNLIYSNHNPAGRLLAADLAGAAGYLVMMILPPVADLALVVWTGRDTGRRRLRPWARVAWVAAAVVLPLVGGFAYWVSARWGRGLSRAAGARS